MELILIAYETPRLNDFEQFKNESREFDKELVEMCKNDGRKGKIYIVSRMRTTDSFFNGLYQSKNYHSPIKLSHPIQVRQYLIDKHKTINRDCI